MLPDPYERWFIEICGRPAPVENRSTCEHCAMLPGAPDLPPEGPFDPVMRCCTYHPHLAPHFVGGILAGDSEEGRVRVKARIAARLGVTPLGLGPTPDYSVIHERLAFRPGTFGRSRELHCAFHHDGRCTVWKQRGMVCAAYHCKFDRGAFGRDLWNVLVIAFNVVERVLARWLLERLGLEVETCDALLRAPREAALDQKAWGVWFGREEAYFLEAARLVEALSFRDVEAIGGRDLAGLADGLRGVLARRDAIPARVRVNGDILHHLGRPGHVRLQNLGLPLDLLEVPAEIVDRLSKSGEAPLADLGLDGELARKLLDWQYLVS
jgi:hypothetical protein